jgi:hypothetical protein
MPLETQPLGDDGRQEPSFIPHTHQPEMSQATAWTFLGAGLGAFLMAFGTELASAHQWAEVMTPAFVGKALVQIGGVGVAIFGALKVRV